MPVLLCQYPVADKILHAALAAHCFWDTPLTYLFFLHQSVSCVDKGSSVSKSFPSNRLPYSAQCALRMEYIMFRDETVNTSAPAGDSPRPTQAFLGCAHQECLCVIIYSSRERIRPDSIPFLCARSTFCGGNRMIIFTNYADPQWPVWAFCAGWKSELLRRRFFLHSVFCKPRLPVSRIPNSYRSN